MLIVKSNASLHENRQTVVIRGDGFECIDLIAERPPMPDLLANVIVDTYSGFSDVTTALSDDVRAFRFLPLSALLKKSVSAPLLVQ